MGTPLGGCWLRALSLEGNSCPCDWCPFPISSAPWRRQDGTPVEGPQSRIRQVCRYALWERLLHVRTSCCRGQRLAQRSSLKSSKWNWNMWFQSQCLSVVRVRAHPWAEPFEIQVCSRSGWGYSSDGKILAIQAVGLSSSGRAYVKHWVWGCLQSMF